MPTDKSEVVDIDQWDANQIHLEVMTQSFSSIKIRYSGVFGHIGAQAGTFVLFLRVGNCHWDFPFAIYHYAWINLFILLFIFSFIHQF